MLNWKRSVINMSVDNKKSINFEEAFLLASKTINEFMNNDLLKIQSIAKQIAEDRIGKGKMMKDLTDQQAIMYQNNFIMKTNITIISLQSFMFAMMNSKKSNLIL